MCYVMNNIMAKVYINVVMQGGGAKFKCTGFEGGGKNVVRDFRGGGGRVLNAHDFRIRICK